MKLNKKKVFYVKEMPDGEEQDISKLKRVSGAEFGALLKESKTKEGGLINLQFYPAPSPNCFFNFSQMNGSIFNNAFCLAKALASMAGMPI